MSDPTRPLAGLRVAYAAFDPFPNRKGSGTRIAQLVRGLTRAGAHVTLLTLPPTSSDAAPDGVELRPLRIVEDNFLARALAFAERVRREVIALRPDLVHFRGPFEGSALTTPFSTRAVPAVFEVNGLPSVELRYHYPALREAPTLEYKLRQLELAVLGRAAAVVTQSHATARFLKLRAGTGPEPLVIPNGADPRLTDSPPPSSVLRLLYAGTLAPWQGLDDLLTAVGRVSRTRDVRLDVVGFGQKRWRRTLVRRARRLKIGDCVSFEHAVARDELAERIEQSDVCVAPLPRDRRNRLQGSSPIKVFEYMASGRAVLATDLPCLREIITDGETGLLARASSPRLLAGRLEELAASDALRQALGRRARVAIEHGATWDHRRAELVRGYRRLLEG